MKKIKLKSLALIIILNLLIQIFFPIIFNMETHALATVTTNDVYDVILFLGQSNMAGSCHREQNTRFDPHNDAEVEEYSELSGISKDILKLNSRRYRNIVSIPQYNGSAFEYRYLNNSIKEITATGEYEIDDYNGENLIYDKNSEKLVDAENSTNKSLSQSNGTNMVPEFCRTYYERTGHKVVAVMAALGGKPIYQFLPYDDKDNLASDEEKDLRLYESIKEKYNSAIEYLNKNNYTIGSKMYVAFQGESDVGKTTATTNANYYNQFMKVHNNLKKDLGIEKGAIVETARISGLYNMRPTDMVHDAQEKLIKNNDDIILGSSFPYDKFVPSEISYNGKLAFDSYGNKLSYEDALKRARSIVDYSEDERKNNAVHLTSAALSQIGREVADNLADTIQNLKGKSLKRKRIKIKDTAQLEINNERKFWIKNGGYVEIEFVADRIGKVEGCEKNIVINKDKFKVIGANGETDIVDVNFNVGFNNEEKYPFIKVKITAKGNYTGKLIITEENGFLNYIDKQEYKEFTNSIAYFFRANSLYIDNRLSKIKGDSKVVDGKIKNQIIKDSESGLKSYTWKLYKYVIKENERKVQEVKIEDDDYFGKQFELSKKENNIYTEIVNEAEISFERNLNNLTPNDEYIFARLECEDLLGNKIKKEFFPDPIVTVKFNKKLEDGSEEYKVKTNIPSKIITNNNDIRVDYKREYNKQFFITIKNPENKRYEYNDYIETAQGKKLYFCVNGVNGDVLF